MSTPLSPETLQAVHDAQAVINAQIERIAATLDAALLQNSSFNHLSIEQLEATILALPKDCFYSVYLKQAWRKRQDATPPAAP